MKKTMFILFLLMILCIPIKSEALATNASDIDYIRIYLFSSDNCSECESVKEWLEDYEKKDNRISVEYLTIDSNKELNKSVKENLNIKNDNIPLIIIGSNYFVGFNDKVKKNLTKAIESYESIDEYCDIVSKIQNNEDVTKCIDENKNIYKQESLSSVFVKAFVIIAGLCLVIVLILLIKKKKLLKR